MNHWAHMLADLPALGQRTLARAQRISLPRRCDAATRLARLRLSLCHAATVRAVYALLPAEAQAALQDLRARRGGIRPAGLAARYGAVRSWPQLAADMAPRSVAERLLLLGWLLPRPATPRHPAHYLVPPEVRRWLPHPLDPPAAPAGPPDDTGAAAHPPALRAAATLLLACAAHPAALTRAGRLTRTALRTLLPRLAPIPPAEAAALLAWLLPLLAAHDLISRHAGQATTTIAGQRFLAYPPAQQRALLQAAWVAAPAPDAWLLRMRVDRRGIDWPLLRRRLIAWGAALPADLHAAAPFERYARMARSLGPLADAQTHGFRLVDRVPWRACRAAAIFDAALHGPLAWLGLVGAAVPAAATDPAAAPAAPASQSRPSLAPGQPYRMRNAIRAAGRPARRPVAARWAGPAVLPAIPALPGPPAAQIRWRYAEPGVVLVPHAAPQDAALHLARLAAWDAADAEGTRYRITPATLARAHAAGLGAAPAWELLEQQAGPPPDAWRAGLEILPALQICHGAVLIADAPGVLAQLRRARSVRRHMQVLAPGLALVRPAHSAPLRRALARQGIAWVGEAPQLPAPAAADGSPGERAAMLVACTYYQRHAPPGAPLLPHAQLSARLRAGLSPQLCAAVDAALADLRPPPPLAAATEAGAVPLDQKVRRLRTALARQDAVTLIYDTGGQGAARTRTVRPLALEQRADHWYLRAYCTARQAERTFRVDRIVALGDAARP